MFPWQLQALHPIKVFRRMNYMETYQTLGGAKKGTWQPSPHLGPSPYQALPLKLLQNIDSERTGWVLGMKEVALARLILLCQERMGNAHSVLNIGVGWCVCVCVPV